MLCLWFKVPRVASAFLNTISVYISRCKRVIIVVSQHYVESKEQRAIRRWQLQFASALAPVSETTHKLVPVKIETNVRMPGNDRARRLCRLCSLHSLCSNSLIGPSVFVFVHFNFIYNTENILKRTS